MAALTAQEYSQLRGQLYRGPAKTAMQSLPTLPSKSQLLATLQTFEDQWVLNETFPVRSVADVAYGQVMPTQLFVALKRLFLQRKGA